MSNHHTTLARRSQLKRTSSGCAPTFESRSQSSPTEAIGGHGRRVHPERLDGADVARLTRCAGAGDEHGCRGWSTSSGA